MRVRADTGFNRAYWGFEMRGVRRIVDPNTTVAKGVAEEAGRFGRCRWRRAAGEPVYPGTYKMVITLNGVSDSTMMVVKGDPNVPVSKELYDARMKVLKTT